MNYFDYIKLFWRSHDEHSFKTTEIALYFYLLEVCNICRWKNQFKRNNIKIQADLGISYNTLKSARNRLKQAGILDFQSKNGNANVTYSLSNFDEVSDEVACEVSDEVCTSKERQRQRLINKEINKESEFEYFFDHYHSITKLPKTDKKAAEKHWNKLTSEEKEKALANVEVYFNSLDDKKYCKKSRTYLSDKNFNDEFKVNTNNLCRWEILNTGNVRESTYSQYQADINRFGENNIKFLGYANEWI